MGAGSNMYSVPSYNMYPSEEHVSPANSDPTLMRKAETNKGPRASKRSPGKQAYSAVTWATGCLLKQPHAIARLSPGPHKALWRSSLTNQALIGPRSGTPHSLVTPSPPFGENEHQREHWGPDQGTEEKELFWKTKPDEG